MVKMINYTYDNNYIIVWLFDVSDDKSCLKIEPVCVLQVLFLGPLMQLAMDCPWSFMDGIRVAFGEIASMM